MEAPTPSWPAGTPRLGVIGHSNAGKTRLVEQLAAVLTAAGVRIGSVKHASHAPTLDARGKDSWRHAQAGARRVLLLGPDVAAAFVHRGAGEELDAWGGFFAGEVDLVLVEGFKHTPMPHVWVEADPAATAFTLTRRETAPPAGPAWRIARPVEVPEPFAFPDALVAELAAAILGELVSRP